MNLVDCKVGDSVIVHEDNKPRQARIEAIGRKYFTVDGSQYDRVTGEFNGKKFGWPKRLYAMERWARMEQERELRASIAALHQATDHHHTLATLSDETIVAMMADLRRIVSTIRASQLNEQTKP